MPRTPRNEFPGVTYHLISRFVDRDWYIRTEAEREIYFRLLARALKASDWSCLAYAVMSNHVHIAAVAGEQPLDSWVRRVHAPFAGYLNRTHERIGGVFVRGPKSHYVAPHEVGSVIAYIHNNPVRAGVVDNARRSTWTSHAAYVGAATRPRWLHVNDGLALSGFRDRTAFDEWVRSAHANRARDPLFELLERRTAYEVMEDTVVEAPPVAARPRVDPRRVVELSSEAAGITVESVCSRRRGHAEVAARVVAVHVGRRLGLTGAEIAYALGITPQAASAIALRSEPPPSVDAIVGQLRS